MKSGNMLSGFFAGVIAGVAIGILFAPAKGSEIRRKLSEKSDIYAGVIESTFVELIENISQQFDSMREGVMQKSESV